MAEYEAYKDSGFEWLGNIPVSWPIVLLSQIVTQVKNKNSDLREQNLLSLSYGRIKRKPIDTNGGLLPESFDGYNVIEANDIVLRLTDLQNDHRSLRVGLATERGIITSAYTTMRPRNSESAKYLYYLLHTFDIRKGFYGMGSGVRQGLNYDEVKKLKLPLPTIVEQEAIAAYLDRETDRIDAIIAEAKASIEEYKAWKASIIYEAVTKGLDPRADTRDVNVVGIRRIPKHWKIANVRYLIDVLTDYTANGSFGDLAKNVQYIDNEGYARLVRLTDLRVNFENEGVYVNEHAYDYLSKSRLHGGEILIANVGAYAGLAVEMPMVDFRATLGPNMFLLKTKQDRWLSHFAYYSLIGAMCADQLKMMASSTTAQPKLNKDNLRSVITFLPPLAEQKQIAEYLDAKLPHLNSLISEKEALITDLEAYKKSLIFEVVTGKRKVV